MCSNAPRPNKRVVDMLEKWRLDAAALKHVGSHMVNLQRGLGG